MLRVKSRLIQGYCFVESALLLLCEQIFQHIVPSNDRLAVKDISSQERLIALAGKLIDVYLVAALGLAQGHFVP